MKKTTFIIMLFIIALIPPAAAAAADFAGFGECIDKIHVSDAKLNNISSSYLEFVENKVDSIMSAPDYAREKIGLNGNYNAQVEQIKIQYSLNLNKAIWIYPLTTSKYLKQYYENDRLDYLISLDKYAAIPNYEINYFTIFNKDGLCIQEQAGTADTLYRSGIMLENGMTFIENSEEIKNMLTEHGETKVNDIKIIIADSSFTFLYIDCENHKYLIRIYSGRSLADNRIPSIECYKLYTVEEVLNIINDFDNQNPYWALPQNVFKIKPLYDTEAQALQAEGLLQGNENGLDLLKPLTRAEAVTLLIRALGLEDTAMSYTSSPFADTPDDHWASSYAALAKDIGITDGVSETEFAPDQQVTSDQFAAFALRAIGESDFDYQQGTQLLIDKGIVTKEQSETMDLFARCDMAKIVYELLKARGADIFLD